MNRKCKSIVKSKSMVTVLVIIVTLLAVLVSSKFAHPRIAHADDGGTVLASSNTVPLLQYPEGLTSWQGKVYVATMDVTGARNHILIFDASTGELLHTVGDTAPQQDIGAGPINGLTIDKSTGDLYAAANGIGYILRIHNPTAPGAHLTVSRYSQYPTGGGPEDMAFDQQGDLYASDSNLGLVYRIPKGGGAPQLVIGPPGSGAPVSDNGLLQSPVAGISPNGMVFSQDYSTLYIANTYTNSVIAFDVNSQGQVTGNARIFAQNLNPALEEYPTGFDSPGNGLLRAGSVTPIGPVASTWLNGPDGLALDSQGDVWVASNLGDNLTELDPTGQLITTYGTSAVTASGLLNQPASLTFVGTSIYATNLGIFTGLAGQPNIPFRVVSYNVGISGAGGNGNY